MADDVDIASEYYDNMLQAHVSKALSGSRCISNSLSECIECGDEIPKERQSAVPGVTTCTSCQNELEQGSTQ